MIKVILFDLDGTLTDPKVGITTCVQYALKEFGIVGFILGPLILGIAYAVIKSLKEELEKDKLESEELEKNESDDY